MKGNEKDIDKHHEMLKELLGRGLKVKFDDPNELERIYDE